jgi:hypothetical protein
MAHLAARIDAMEGLGTGFEPTTGWDVYLEDLHRRWFLTERQLATIERNAALNAEFHALWLIAREVLPSDDGIAQWDYYSRLRRTLIESWPYWLQRQADRLAQQQGDNDE